jgi:hypothetical protein
MRSSPPPGPEISRCFSRSQPRRRAVADPGAVVMGHRRTSRQRRVANQARGDNPRRAAVVPERHSESRLPFHGDGGKVTRIEMIADVDVLGEIDIDVLRGGR